MRILLFLMANAFAAFNWSYSEKIASENRCKDRFVQNPERNSACLLGVAVYGDARSWSGINTTRNQAQSFCQTLCLGASESSSFCQNGCQFARNEDQ